MACVYFSTASPNCPFLNNILPSFLSLASEGGRAPHGASRLQLSPAVPLCAGPEPWGSSLLLPAERVPFTAVLFPWTSFELAVLFPWLLLFPGVPGWECGPPPSPWPGAFFCEFPMASLSPYHSTASSRPHTQSYTLSFSSCSLRRLWGWATSGRTRLLRGTLWHHAGGGAAELLQSGGGFLWNQQPGEFKRHCWISFVWKINCRALQLTLLRISALLKFTVRVVASERLYDVISVLSK